MKSFNEFSEGLKQARKNVGADKCWDGYKAKGTKKKDGKEVPNCVKEGKKKGLWDNIHAKRKRGEKPAKPGDKDYPKTLNVEEGAAWTKKSGKNPSGGLNEKGRKSYERENPGSDLKAPSKKVGNKRRASFCARMKGMKKKLTSAKTARDPDSRINKSLRAWNCERELDGNVINEEVGYKSFIKQAQDARDRVKQKGEEMKKKDASYIDRVRKGIKFYDKKGSGRIVKGQKVYD